MLAVHSTVVPPAWYRTLPGLVRVKRRWILTGRSSVTPRDVEFMVSTDGD
jgi:hypothetical protein